MIMFITNTTFVYL